MILPRVLYYNKKKKSVRHKSQNFVCFVDLTKTCEKF